MAPRQKAAYQEMPLFDLATPIGTFKAVRLPTFYPDTPGSKREGPASEAARSLDRPQIRQVHRQILALLEHHAMTADEAAASLGLKVLYCRPRFSELVKLGLIEATGERRSNAGSRLSAGVYQRKREGV